MSGWAMGLVLVADYALVAMTTQTWNGPLFYSFSLTLSFLLFFLLLSFMSLLILLLRSAISLFLHQKISLYFTLSITFFLFFPTPHPTPPKKTLLFDICTLLPPLGLNEEFCNMIKLSYCLPSRTHEIKKNNETKRPGCCALP